MIHCWQLQECSPVDRDSTIHSSPDMLFFTLGHKHTTQAVKWGHQLWPSQDCCCQPPSSRAVGMKKKKNKFHRRSRTRAGLVISNVLGTWPERTLNWEVFEWLSYPCPRKWHLPNPKICRATERGVSSLKATLNFQVTDIHAHAPHLLTDSKVNTYHFSIFLFSPGASSLSLALSSLDS